jgi:hypothetical protein
MVGMVRGATWDVSAVKWSGRERGSSADEEVVVDLFREE